MGKSNKTALYNAALHEFRKLGRDSSGKWRNESALNKVCYDLFGKKEIATKLAPNSKPTRVEKCIASFDFEALIAILADDKSAHALYVAVMAKKALSSGKQTGKELKVIKKSYKKIIENLSAKFAIEKVSDDLFAELEKVTNDYDDDYDFDFDDDEYDFDSVWEDDDGVFTKASRRYGSKARNRNSLAQLLYGKSTDVEEGSDDKNISKIIDVLESVTDKISDIEDRLNSIDDGDDSDYDEYEEASPRSRTRSQRANQRVQPVRSSRRYRNPPPDDGWEPVEYDDEDDDEEYYFRSPPTPADVRNAGRPASNDNITPIASAIDSINNNISTLTSVVAETSRAVKSMQNDLVDTMENVSQIMSDIYEPDDGDNVSESPPNPPPRNAGAQPQYPIRDSDKR